MMIRLFPLKKLQLLKATDRCLKSSANDVIIWVIHHVGNERRKRKNHNDVETQNCLQYQQRQQNSEVE